MFPKAREPEKGHGEVGPDQKVGFPNTAYYLPIIYGILGIPVKTLGEARNRWKSPGSSCRPTSRT